MHKMNTDNWIAIGLLVVIVAAATVFVYWPQHRQLNEIERNVISQRLTIEANAGKAALIAKMKKRIDALKVSYEGLERRLPKSIELGEFLQEINLVLAAGKLRHQSTEPGKPKSEELFHTLPIKMKFQGSYLALADLLQSIHHMQRLTRIGKLTIKRLPKSGELSIEAHLNIYFQRG